MAPETCRKLKALMIIAMLAVAEGRRIENDLNFADAFESHSSSSSHGKGKRGGHQASEALGASSEAPLDLDILLKDPAFHKQLEAMAAHMDTFAERMKAKPDVLARATEMSQEMFTLSAFPTYEDMVKEASYADSKLPRQMEAMIADREFQEQAQLFAEDMQKSVLANKDFQEELEAFTAESIQSSQKQSEVVSEKLVETMVDPSFQQQQESVSRVLNSLMLDPDLQSEAESIAAYIEQAKGADSNLDSGVGHDIAQEVSAKVDAAIANTKFQEKASDVVFEMLSAELQDDMNKLHEDKWLEDIDLEELANAVENPSPELVAAMEEVRRAKTKQPSLLEVGQTSGQESDKVVPGALTMMTSPALAFNFGSGGRAPATPSTGARHQPALGGMAAARFPRPWRRVSELAATDRGADPRMSMEDDNNPSLYTMYSKEDFASSGGFVQSVPEDSAASGEAPAQMFQGTGPDTDVQPLTSAKGIRSMMPSLVKALPRRAKGAVMSAGEKKGGVDIALLLCFGLWYLGNYYYNISNKIALTAAGGAAGFPMTIATLQLGVGVIYALFMWIAPDARKRPDMTFKDYVATLPVGAMSAGAHAASVFALGAGSVSFAQIVKASEPAFAAVIGTYAYSAKLSKAKWLSLIPVIGGVCLASLGELNFAMGALVTASIANIFAAIKGNENAKLMKNPGLSDRIGSVGNQFAITTINAFLFTLPVMLLTEGARLGQFFTLMKTSPLLLNNLIGSGLWFYLYNELATLTIKKTDAVTQSVANTAKRVIVIIVVALVMKESLTPLKLIGSGIGIGGVFLYSIIDKLVAARKAKLEAKAAGNVNATSGPAMA